MFHRPSNNCHIKRKKKLNDTSWGALRQFISVISYQVSKCICTHIHIFIYFNHTHTYIYILQEKKQTETKTEQSHITTPNPIDYKKEWRRILANRLFRLLEHAHAGFLWHRTSDQVARLLIICFSIAH